MRVLQWCGPRPDSRPVKSWLGTVPSRGDRMGLKLIVVVYFTLVSMVFALGVIAVSIDHTHHAKAVDNAYLVGR
jgi:hypothetical protein